jgi:hypothetical protein
MYDSVTLARLTVAPFALVEWTIVALFVLRWNVRPWSITRIATTLLSIAAPVGFLFAEFYLYDHMVGYEAGSDHVFYVEVFGQKLVSGALLFLLLYKQGKAGVIGAPALRTSEVPVVDSPRLVLEVIGVAVVGVMLVTAIPREILAKHVWLVQIGGGLVLGIVISRVRKKKSIRKEE